MITHRMVTQPPPEPPVRFYKFIALSFLVITVVLLGVVIFVTSKKAEIIIVAKEDNEDVSLVVNVEKNGPSQGAIRGTVSSTVFHWSGKYHPTGTKKVEGTSEGEVTIYNKTSADQPLVKTTRVLTDTGILFRLTKGVVVPANGAVVAPVYADQPGVTSDIGPSKFTIPGLLPIKQTIIFAESQKPMTGGERTAGLLSDDDIKNAQVDFQQKMKEAFLATIHDTVGEEKAVATVDLRMTSSHKAGEEVSEFTISGESTVIIVSYNSEDLSNLESREIANKIDVASERFLALDKKPEVSVASYNLKEGTAELTVRQKVVVTLDANVEKLAPRNFLGKKKEEIQRYLMGLDHVAKVEINFSPGWASSAPTVPERIRVVVKNVQ